MSIWPGLTNKEVQTAPCLPYLDEWMFCIAHCLTSLTYIGLPLLFIINFNSKDLKSLTNTKRKQL